jgi:DNA topoisomerase I
MRTGVREANYWLRFQFSSKEGTKSDFKWQTLEHNGVLFPAEYQPQSIPVIYEGEQVLLSPEAEEVAGFYAKYKGSDYDTKVFQRNFWADWKPLLVGTPIVNLEACDFVKFNEAAEVLKLYKQEHKEELIAAREAIEAPFRTALVDGKEQPVGGFRVEPPGLFIGRGAHPLAGHVKKRVRPEDITLNLGEDATIPIPIIEPGIIQDSSIAKHDVDGGGQMAWGAVVHDHYSEWLASWADSISGKTKYIWLGSTSNFKSASDMQKFDLARKLKRNIGRIRAAYEADLASEDLETRQKASALYLIDRLALRVGNEKGSTQADTVGVTSLRVEHIKLAGSLTAPVLSLDFLGKDSVRYQNQVVIPEQLFTNLTEFVEGKAKKDSLFDRVDSTKLNAYLQEQMPDLTAKVFRTCNASALFQKELNRVAIPEIDSPASRKLVIDAFNKANTRVAKLCNHTKAPSTSYAASMAKLDEQITALKTRLKSARARKAKNIPTIKARLDQLIGRKELKQEMKGVSLGTSKTNYLDPRITVAFMKKHNIEIGKLLTKALQEKFKWALDTTADFTF